MNNHARRLTGILFFAAIAGTLGCNTLEVDPGDCSPACDVFQTCCDESCVFGAADPNNCGGCGVVCASGMCREGLCVQGGPDAGGQDAATTPDAGVMTACGIGFCSGAQLCCDDRCQTAASPAGADGRSDTPFTSCGGCDVSCDATRASACSLPAFGGTPQCMCGQATQCNVGEECANTGSGFRCVHLATDPENCGEIGFRCAEGETCSESLCQCAGGEACTAGATCCPGAGCVAPDNDDPNNCGGCGIVCGAGSPNCVAGVCQCGTSGETCREATKGILGDSDAGQVCCDDLCIEADESNCGGCGVTCGAESCLVGGIPGFSDIQVCCGPLDFLSGCPVTLPMPDAGMADGGVLPDAGAFDAGPALPDASLTLPDASLSLPDARLPALDGGIAL